MSENFFYYFGIRNGSCDAKELIVVPPNVFTKRRNCDEGYFVADSNLFKSEIRINLWINLEDICKEGWKSKKFNPNVF